MVIIAALFVKKMMEEKKVHRLLVIGSDDKIVVKLSIGDIAGKIGKSLFWSTLKHMTM